MPTAGGSAGWSSVWPTISLVLVSASTVTCRWISSWLKVCSWWTTKSSRSSSAKAMVIASSTSSGKYPQASISERRSFLVVPNLMSAILPCPTDSHHASSSSVSLASVGKGATSSSRQPASVGKGATGFCLDDQASTTTPFRRASEEG